MKRIILDKDIRPLSEFRANAASFIEQVRSTKRPLVITQHGKSSAVILDVHEYESLLEKIDLLQDIQTAESQLDMGLGLEHETAKKEILSQLSKMK